MSEFDRVEQPPVDRRRNWWPWALSGVLLLVLIGLAIWYFTRAEKATVAPVTGQTAPVAVARLQGDGFKTQIIRRVSGRRPGTVVGEQPVGGSKADKGSLVVLTVASAPTSVSVPNAVGISQGDARDRLVAAGFRVKSASVYSGQPVGTVVAQAPAAGEKISRGTAVRINVSKGSATATVPSEVGQTSDDAQRDLAAKGFKPGILQVPSDQPAGTVVAQNPSGGQAAQGHARAVEHLERPDRDHDDSAGDDRHAPHDHRDHVVQQQRDDDHDAVASTLGRDGRVRASSSGTRRSYGEGAACRSRHSHSRRRAKPTMTVAIRRGPRFG